MARTAPKPKRAANGYVLPAEKFKQRETAFAIYRDMGENRSMARLVVAFAKEHPAWAVTRSALENWSGQHDWAARAREHDNAIARGRAEGVTTLNPLIVGAEPDFNQTEALLKAANQALVKAMNANPVVTRPGDVKSLVDAAAHALKLVETIKQQSSGKVSAAEVAAEMERILEEVQKARDLDVELLVEAELKKRGIALDASGEVVDAGSARARSPDGGASDAIDVDTGTVEDLARAEAELAAAAQAMKADEVDSAGDQPGPAGVGGLVSFEDALAAFKARAAQSR